jgi:hypothetical protein
MLSLHRSLLSGDTRLLHLDTSRMQVTPTSIHPGSASNQFQRLLVRRQQYGPRHPYDQGQKKFLLPHFSISWRFAGTIQVQYGILGTPIHQYFQHHARTTQQCTTRLSRTTKGQKVPSHTSQQLTENSWTHQGDANVMASLHCHLCDAPIYGWACIFITVLIASTTISTGPTVLLWLGSSQG